MSIWVRVKRGQFFVGDREKRASLPEWPGEALIQTRFPEHLKVVGPPAF